MPLAVPPTSSIPLYARNKDTGETFLIGPPASMINDLGDVDTATTGPVDGDGLVWDAALGQWVPGAPASALAFWDPVVNYVTDDKVLWPETAPISLWKARRDNINEEPVEPTAGQVPGFDFTTGNVNAGNFPSGLDFSAGMETVILLSGPVAASGEFFMFGPQMGGTTCRLAIVGADLAFGVAFNGPVTNYTTPLAGWDSVTNPYLKVACDTVNVVFSQSADGSTFTDIATVATPGADLSDSWQVGIGNMYLGALASVETKNGAGVLQQSWVAATQDPATGAGVSAKTGETYSGAAVPSVPGDPAWALLATFAPAEGIDDLDDVDTSTVPPADGDGLVWDAASGQWVPGPGGSEVEITDVDPLAANAQAELWYQPEQALPVAPVALWDIAVAYAAGDYCQWPTAVEHWQASAATTAGEEPGVAPVWVSVPAPVAAVVPGMLRANVNGAWVDVAAAEAEVEVDAVEPTGDWELWVDTSALAPPPGVSSLGIDDLSDVDTATTAPTDQAPLIWDTASSQWLPAVSASLPLAGGTMASNAVISFPNEADKAKIILYGNTTTGFGLGITSGSTNIFASSTIRFRKDSITGAEWGSVDANGFTANGVWVPTLKVISNVTLVVGHWYEISTVDYHRTVRFKFGAIGPGKPTRAQSLDGNAALYADAGEGVSEYSGYLSIFGHIKGSQANNKLFSSIGVGPTKLWIKCSQAATVQVGIEAYDTVTGARTMLSMADAGTAPGVWDEVAL